MDLHDLIGSVEFVIFQAKLVFQRIIFKIPQLRHFICIWLETHCPGIFVTPSPAWCPNFSHHGKRVIHCSND